MDCRQDFHNEINRISQYFLANHARHIPDCFLRRFNGCGGQVNF